MVDLARIVDLRASGRSLREIGELLGVSSSYIGILLQRFQTGVDPTKETKRRYWHSRKGREAQERYSGTDKGRAARSSYLQSDKGKATLHRYYVSEKGQEAHRRSRER